VEKLQLGWLDYDQVEPGQSKTVDLGPSYHATSRKQAVVVHLPDGTQTNNAGAGPSNGGAKYLFSGTQDDATTTVTSPAFTVPAGAQLTADTNFSTEKDWDYAYAEVSTDGGKTFTPIATNFSTDTNPNNQNDGHGITGSSGGWKPLTASLADYAGQQAQLRFRMFNDANTHGFGFKVDNIRVGDALSEDVEGGAPDWTRDGFRVVTNGTYQTSFSRYYLAENRQYGGYDSTLAQGPYNFGWAATRPSWVERYPYQNGLLVWYWNTGTTDNNTSQHPGFGEATPVDARPTALKWSDGTVARNRIQPFDATFGLNKTDPISLHREVVKDGQPVMTTLEVGKQNPVPVFDDTDPNAYYDANNPTGSVKVAGTGTTIRVLKENDTKDEMTVKVN
jgi:immune inhibitor A